MKIIFHNDFRQSYTNDPAAARGRLDASANALDGRYQWIVAQPAAEEDILAAHSPYHLDYVKRVGVYDIAALAAGGAIQAAETGMTEPAFALIRPPGHHASEESAWGFCYFNNVSIALERLRRSGKIRTAHLLDFDLHYGDGNVNILRKKGYVSIHNPMGEDRVQYLDSVAAELASVEVDVIAVCAGFDNHLRDWGGLLLTEDYRAIGLMLREACDRLGVGCFALLEGGYNDLSMAEALVAFLEGLEGIAAE